MKEYGSGYFINLKEICLTLVREAGSCVDDVVTDTVVPASQTRREREREAPQLI